LDRAGSNFAIYYFVTQLIAKFGRIRARLESCRQEAGLYKKRAFRPWGANDPAAEAASDGLGQSRHD